MGEPTIRARSMISFAVTAILAFTFALPAQSAFAEPISPQLEIAITPIRLRPAQAGMVLVTGGYPLDITVTLDDQPLDVAHTGDAYMSTYSFDFDEPEGEHLLEVTATNPVTGEQLTRTETIVVAAFDYPEELVALPFSLIPLLEPSLNAAEEARLDEIYSVRSEQTDFDFLFAVPVPGGIITSGFGGDRTYNGGIWQSYHTGSDFRRDIGESVVAAADGIVVTTEGFDVRGNVVIIHHGLGIYTQYAHLSEILVGEGDFIRQGELVGLAGATGRINAPHLHFEIIIDGNPIDPIRWLALTPGFVAPEQLPPRQIPNDDEEADADEDDTPSEAGDDATSVADEPTPIPTGATPSDETP